MNIYLDKFSLSIKEISVSVIDCTIELYENIKKDLLPIPGKSHYQFNLRDISKVFAGLSQLSPKYTQNQIDYVRAWYHECQRVFSDRLVNQ